MTSPGPALQKCTGFCHENVPTSNAVISNLRSTDCIGQDRDSHHLGTLSNIYNTSQTMKPSDPLLLPNVALRCGMYPAGKVDIS